MILAAARPLLMLLACLALAGCSSGMRKTVRPQPELKLSALAVYPFGFRWEEPAYRSFELTHRLMEVAQAKVGDGLYLFGPSDFKVLRQEDNSWVSNTFVTVLPSVAIRPERAAVLRPWAEKIVFEHQGEVLDKKGKRIGQAATFETTYVGHVEVIHPSTREVLVEVVAEAKVDPFADPPEDDSDPAPLLTTLMERLTAEALSAISDYASPPGEARDLRVTLGFNPKLAITYSEQDRPALELKLAAMDPLESEMLVQSRIRYANPGITDAELARLARLQGGLWVKAAEAGAKLSPGDLITTIEGLPALPQLLQRRRFASVPIQAKVRRATGETVDVLLP